MSQVFWSFLYFLAFALWIGGSIGAVVHLVTRVHADAWLIVLVAVALVLLPVITVLVYWLVIASLRLIRGRRQPTSARVRPATDLPWPPPPPPARAGS